MKQFKDMIALITGGACGIGLGIGRSLAAEGAHPQTHCSVRLNTRASGPSDCDRCRRWMGKHAAFSAPPTLGILASRLEWAISSLPSTRAHIRCSLTARTFAAGSSRAHSLLAHRSQLPVRFEA